MRQRNTLTITAFIIFALILSGSAYGAAPWWNTKHLQREEITLNNPNNITLYNYTENINISYEPRMNASFSDVRFVYYNQSTGVSTLLGSTDNSTYATLPDTSLKFLTAEYAIEAVKIPILEAGENTPIYLYYDNSNSNVSSVADANNAYIFYNNGSTLQGWTNFSATIDLTSGKPAPSLSVGPSHYAYIDAIPLFNSSERYEIDVDFYTSLVYDFYFLDNSLGVGQKLRFDARGTYSSCVIPSGSWASWGASITSPLGQAPSNTWFSARILTINTTYITVKTYNDLSATLPSDVQGGYIGIGASFGSGDGGLFDNIIIRKYAPITPTYTISSPQSILFVPYIISPQDNYLSVTQHVNFSIQYRGWNLTSLSLYLPDIGWSYGNTSDLVNGTSSTYTFQDEYIPLGKHQWYAQLCNNATGTVSCNVSATRNIKVRGNNSLLVTFYDENTLQKITHTNITIKALNSTNYAVADSAVSYEGTAGIDLLNGTFFITAVGASTSPYPYLTTRFVTVTSSSNLNIYLLSNTTTVVYDTFTLQDNSYLFPSTDTILSLTKYVSGVSVQAYVGFFDIVKQTGAYLNLNSHYEVTVTNTKTGEKRILGWLLPSTSGAVTLTVSQLQLTPTMSQWLTYNISSDNNSGLIQYAWNSTLNISQVQLWINYSENKSLVYYINTSAPAGSISSYVNSSLNYILTVIVTTQSGKTWKKSEFIIFNKEGWIKGVWDILPTGPGWGWLYTAISLAAIMLVLLSFGKERVETATGLAVALTFFFYYINWLTISYLALAVIGLVAAFMILQKGRKEIE